jgi:hypothetical protein
MNALRCSYVVPFRQVDAAPGTLNDLARDFRRVGATCEVIVVDGSPPEDFARHAVAWRGLCRHMPVDPRWRFLNGKVNGVLTGVSAAGCDAVILADDDVVYHTADIRRMCELLASRDLVVPQNYFNRLPWWARIATGRILLNRAIRPEGDYPGTVGLRRSTFLRIGPYDGDVLFENEEMRRHFLSHRTRVLHARDFLIARRPPSLAKWREQRLRQAYEDLDLPFKTSVFAALAPVGALVGLAIGTTAAAIYAVGVMATAFLLAAVGRTDGAAAVIPISTCLGAALWVLERSIMVHAALWTRLVRGGCAYGGRIIARGVGRLEPRDLPASFPRACE